MRRYIIITLLLITATSMLQAQLSSRFMAGIGGGLAGMGRNDKIVKNDLGGSGVAKFNYTFTYDMTVIGLGVTTGLNVTYFYGRLKMDDHSDDFVRFDYRGQQLNYTVTTSSVRYAQNAVHFEIPVMFAFKSEHAYFNIGAKFYFPLWNNYKQTISGVSIQAHSPSLDKTFIDDPSTGVFPDELSVISGREDVDPVHVGFSMELGSVWEIRNGHSLGVELYVDAISVGLCDNLYTGNNVVSVGNITKAGEQPAVTAYSLPKCYGFQSDFGKTGIRLVYSFDMQHKRKNEPAKEEPIILLTPKN